MDRGPLLFADRGLTWSASPDCRRAGCRLAMLAAASRTQSQLGPAGVAIERRLTLLGSATPGDAGADRRRLSFGRHIALPLCPLDNLEAVRRALGEARRLC